MTPCQGRRTIAGGSWVIRSIQNSLRRSRCSRRSRSTTSTRRGSSIASAGSSSGGCLSAAVALLARDRGGPRICFQLLNSPVLDDRLETVSMTAFTDTPVWDRQAAVVSWRHYLGDRREEEVPYYAA